MNCHQFEQMLDDHLDGYLSEEQDRQVTAHIDNCAQCQRVLAQAKDVQKALKTMPVPRLPDNYAERQFQRLWSEQNFETGKRGFHHLFQPGLAAALLVGILLGGGMVQWLSSSEPSLVSQPLTVNLYDTREVRFVVNSRSDLQGARVTLRIPEHMELQGFPGRHELTWTTNLKAGANLLSLPLRAADLGSGEVVMMIDSPGGTLVEKTLVIESSGKRTTGRYQPEGVTG